MLNRRAGPVPARMGWLAFVIAGCVAAAGAAPAVTLWRAFGPKVLVAPDFSLIDQDGRRFTLSALRGHPVIVFFGYTHCPDVCPTTLAHLARAMHAPTTPADERVVFITVDPDRDSPAALKRYVRLFDARFTGLTGSTQRLERVYAEYHVARRIDRAGQRSSDYAVVHGTSLYYIGRSGVIKGFGSWQDDVPALIADLHAFT